MVASPSPVEPDQQAEPSEGAHEQSAVPQSDHEPEVAEEQTKEIVAPTVVPEAVSDEPVEASPKPPTRATEVDDEPEPEPASELDMKEQVLAEDPLVAEEPHDELVPEKDEPQPAHDVNEPEAAPAEPEEDEEVRRKRIAERIARSGGFNPFTGGMPPPARRDSVESPRSAASASSPPPPVRRDSYQDNASRIVPPPQRKESVGSARSSGAEVEAPPRRYSTDGN